MASIFKYLSDEQKEGLTELPFAVLIPATLPEGWQLDSIELDESEDGVSFALKVRSGSKSCAFLASNEGVGDAVGGHRASKHLHPEFGEISVEHEEDGASLSDWIETENGWSAVGGSSLEDQDLDLLIPLLAVF